MIKIIKEGKTDFRLTCDKCGCIFEYNVEDIDDCYIKCPTCHKQHYAFEPDYELEKNTSEHSPTELVKPKRQSDYYTTPIQTTPEMPNYQSLNECEGCPTYKKLCSPNGYVGDLPCQWCSRSPWRVTCEQDYQFTYTQNNHLANTYTISNDPEYYSEDITLDLKDK